MGLGRPPAKRSRRGSTRIEALNPTFRAYTTVDAPGARARAKEVDAAHRDGRWLGVLDGMTIAVKDNIDTAGIRTASGSLLFADRVPNADAPVVERLRRAGGIILGKASMMELAFGVRGLDQIGGQCRNPWDPAHVPGGSSARVGSGGGARSLRRRARDRYRGLGPHSGGLLRRHRAEADPWARPQPRGVSGQRVLRHGRPDGAPRRRRGAAALGHRRI